MATQGQLKT